MERALQAGSQNNLQAGKKIRLSFLKERHLSYKWRQGDEVREFDTNEPATEVYGFHHNQRVLTTKGRFAGREGVIVGTRSGWLWRHDKGNPGATAFFARNRKDLEDRYGLRDICCQLPATRTASCGLLSISASESCRCIDCAKMRLTEAAHTKTCSDGRRRKLKVQR
ncbi:hypothetical protein DIPPA_07730 [Diplonema papillatum]|nr:hypothetical protein DIPPA_07730 [Diplonema papillatum]